MQAFDNSRRSATTASRRGARFNPYGPPRALANPAPAEPAEPGVPGQLSATEQAYFDALRAKISANPGLRLDDNPLTRLIITYALGFQPCPPKYGMSSRAQVPLIENSDLRSPRGSMPKIDGECCCAVLFDLAV
jgi:hypothetical protein